MLLPEWAPQDGIMLSWPPPASDWLPWLTEVEATFANIVQQVSQYQQVLIICYNNEHRQYIQSYLNKININRQSLQYYIAPTNDSWVRDYGPLTLKQQQHQLIDFVFNGWGNQYPAALDNRVTQTLYQQQAFNSIPLFHSPLILEGGSIETDGQGTLLTTQCLLQRNPTLTKTNIEHHLKQTLAVKRIFWLDGQLPGDDTLGHIDTFARFCNPHTIAYVEHPNLPQLKQQLLALRTDDNQSYHLIPLPSPSPTFNEEQHPLPATYANFLIINQAVLVPIYNDIFDQQALTQLTLAFPQRKIIGIDCTALIQQYGSLHCVTMQLPKGVMNKQG